MGRLRALLAVALLLLSCFGLCQLQGVEGRPLFPWLDPSRLQSMDWPLLLPLGGLSLLFALPGLAAAPGPSRLPRPLAALGLLLILGATLVPQPVRFHNILPARPGLPSVPAMLDGKLVQQEWMPKVRARAPVAVLHPLLGSERSLASLAHGISAQAERERVMAREIPAEQGQRHQRFRALAWQVQGFLVVALVGAPLALLALVLPLCWTLARPRTPARRLGRLALVVVLLVFALPQLCDVLLAGACLLAGLPEAAVAAPRVAAVAAVRLACFLAAWGAGGLLVRSTPSAPLTAALLALVACGADVPPAGDGQTGPAQVGEQAHGPDILVILAPGLREDMRDGPRPVQRLLGDSEGVAGLRFRSAYAQSPSPFTSLGSLLTGRYPSAIPLCGLADLDGSSGEISWCAGLPDERRTLPEVLGLYGYRTALVGGSFPGVDRLVGGFQQLRWVSPSAEQGGTDPDMLLTRAARWWNADSAQPRLLVVLLPDLLLENRPDLTPVPSWAIDPPASLRPLVAKDPHLFRRISGASPELLAPVYEQEAARLGQVIRELRARLEPPSDRALATVLASPCGMDLAEPGGTASVSPTFGPDRLLLDRTVHVPLLILPDSAVSGPVASVASPVELVDIFPTLAALAGATPPAGLPGQDLLLTSLGQPDLAWAYAEHGDMLALRQGALLFSFRALQHHGSSLDPALTSALLASRRDRHRSSLHDVVSDPLQLQDLVPEQPGRAESMRKRLGSLRRGPAAPPDGALTAEQIWELRMTPAQGYW